MKHSRLVVLLLALSLFFVLTACGGDSSPSVPKVSPADEQALAEKLAAEAQKVPEPAADTTDGAGAPTQVKEAAALDKLVGDWVDVSNPDRFVKITKDGDAYKYQDNDGTYPGTAGDGFITVKISDDPDDTAKVFIDQSTGNLVTNYQGDIYEFTRKLS